MLYLATLLVVEQAVVLEHSLLLEDPLLLESCAIQVLALLGVYPLVGTGEVALVFEHVDLILHIVKVPLEFEVPQPLHNREQVLRAHVDLL